MTSSTYRRLRKIVSTSNNHRPIGLRPVCAGTPARKSPPSAGPDCTAGSRPVVWRWKEPGHGLGLARYPATRASGSRRSTAAATSASGAPARTTRSTPSAPPANCSPGSACADASRRKPRGHLRLLMIDRDNAIHSGQDRPHQPGRPLGTSPAPYANGAGLCPASGGPKNAPNWPAHLAWTARLGSCTRP
jgi:hypothetical protein